MPRFLLFVLLLTPASLAQAAYDVTLPSIGVDEAAIAHFERGVELLHSFEYDDARDAFRAARRLAPEAGMTYWGEAMTHNHPVWQRQEREEGLAVVAEWRTVEDSLRAGSVLRRSYSNGFEPPRGRSSRASDHHIETVRVLFGAPGSGFEDATKEDRDDAYLALWTAHFQQLLGGTSLYTDDRAFLALAILGSAHEGRDYEVYGRAADMAQSVLDQDPEHPGALHYLIHAYDDPDHAALALPAARAYSEIVSAASHALHMPTHIYFALGLWDEASALNVRAFEAARDASARRGEPLNNHGWHALYWLAYSELQRDSVDSAISILKQARELYGADSSRLALAHLVRIRAALVAGGQVAERSAPAMVGDWTHLPRENMSPETLAADLLAETYWVEIGQHADGAPDRFAQADALLADTDASATVRATALMVVALNGEDLDLAAFEELAQAADLVDASPVAFGPPAPAHFPHEVLAPFYLAAGRLETAECMMRSVLARAPGRRLAERLANALEESRVLLPESQAPPDSDGFLGGLPQLPDLAACRE